MNEPRLSESAAEETAIVAIVDDEPLVRNAISLWLRTSGFVTRSFATAQDVMAWITPAAPAVIITDVRMPGMDGQSLIAALRAVGCAQPVIVVTGHADVPLAVEVMKAGASEFLEKPVDPQSLVSAVRRCAAALEVMNRARARKAAIQELLASLSPRETEVLDQLVDGSSNKVIAAALKISPRTVEIHRAHVMTKMRVSSMSDLVKLAVAVRPQ